MLSLSFYNQDTLTVARKLLGKQLMRRFPDGLVVRLPIIETEAYDGPEDKASHASRGRTPRTEVMFGPPGQWYVYLVYGMHNMLNIVTGPAEYPAAVLIRGAGDIVGPARLTKHLAIDRSFNTFPANIATGLWIEEGEAPPAAEIETAPRVGVPYAGEWAEVPYRFCWKR